MYTSVTVTPFLNPSQGMFTQGTLPKNVTNGTAEVVIGQEYVLVSTKFNGKSDPAPTVGETYRITGLGGLNLVGIYIGQPSGAPEHSLRFKIAT